MAGRRAGVWWHEQLVGSLIEDERGLMQFAYTPDWLQQSGFPVSLSLPVSVGDQLQQAHSFFAGLLPEGGTRLRICRSQGISTSDDMGLLLAIGEDCAGALTILPADKQPETNEQSPAALDADAISRIIRQHGQNVMQLTGKSQRFSLAGAQDKLPVRIEAGNYSLASSAWPSTHILKFETIKQVCFAESMANRLAQALDLPVVETRYLSSPPLNKNDEEVPYLLIQRYDRQQDQNGHIRRLHQEDALQALGEPASLKYQSDGGPSFAEVVQLVREHADRPAVAIARLRDWQIFNYLCGNWDGHAKNISFYYPLGESTPTLAPFYDLVAIEYLNQTSSANYTREMALYVGEQSNPDKLGKKDWEQFAAQIGIPAKPLMQRLAEIAERIPEACESCLEAFPQEHAITATQEALQTTIQKRSRWVLQSVLR